MVAIVTAEEIKAKLWYLAHPYSGDEEHNFDKVNEIGSELFRHGIIFYSPISMSHPIHIAEERPSMWKEWMRFDKVFMNLCDGLILSPRWTISKGCRYERKQFKKLDKPVYTLDEILTILLHVEDEV